MHFTFTWLQVTQLRSVEYFFLSIARQLVELYEKYSEAAGLRILAFPCNQFGGQEPGTEAEIKEFATGRYNVTFDMFSKIDVNGDDTHPLWVYLKVLTIERKRKNNQNDQKPL